MVFVSGVLPRLCSAVPPRAFFVLQALALEDSPSGVASAAAAGVKVVGVTTAYSSAELRASGAELTVPHYVGLYCYCPGALPPYPPGDRPTIWFTAEDVLSNFCPGHPVRIAGKVWPTSEHYYQSRKFAGVKHPVVTCLRAVVSGLCSVPGPRDGTGGGGGWVRGYEGKKQFVCLKWASHFWRSIQNFIFHPRKFLLLLGGWVVWLSKPKVTFSACIRKIPNFFVILSRNTGEHCRPPVHPHLNIALADQYLLSVTGQAASCPSTAIRLTATHMRICAVFAMCTCASPEVVMGKLNDDLALRALSTCCAAAPPKRAFVALCSSCDTSFALI